MQPADYVARWGNSASLALLDPACKIFSTPTAPGIIGYRMELKNVIVFGDPLCAPEDLSNLTLAFHTHFQGNTNNIIYVAASEKFTNWALKNRCKAAIGFGNELILDPTNDPRLGSGEKASLLRRKCNQASRQGVYVREYHTYDATLERAIEGLGAAWIKARTGPQIYLQHVHIFIDRQHKRYFYAEREGGIIGALILNRIDAYKGWVLSFLMVAEGAPKGTSELIIACALEILGKENCHFFSIGTVPSASLNRIEGLGRFTASFARNVYTLSKRAFGFGDRHRYWKKFRPTTEATYLVLSKPSIGIGGVLGIMRAFNAHV